MGQYFIDISESLSGSLEHSPHQLSFYPQIKNHNYTRSSHTMPAKQQPVQGYE